MSGERKPDRFHGQGGSYIVRSPGAERERVERTEEVDQQTEEVRIDPASGKRSVVKRETPAPEETKADTSRKGGK